MSVIIVPVKWEKITELYKDTQNHYWDHSLEQYEILNNLFKNVETVKCIGGGPNIDFFIAQLNNNIKECINIDKYLCFLHHNSYLKQKEYKELFSYKGEYEFVIKDAREIPVFDKSYDCIIDNCCMPDQDYTLTNPPKMYIINHNKHIEKFQLCMDFDKVIPMQFATRESCFYSFDYIEPINEHYETVEKELKVNNKTVPLILGKSNNPW